MKNRVVFAKWRYVSGRKNGGRVGPLTSLVLDILVQDFETLEKVGTFSGADGSRLRLIAVLSAIQHALRRRGR